MRSYVGVTPSQIRDFLEENFASLTNYLLLDDGDGIDSKDDLEEKEFELSLSAARESQEIQIREGKNNPKGFVLALEVDSVSLTQPLLWSSVDSILVMESDEEELSWYAPQEAEIFLPQWLA